MTWTVERRAVWLVLIVALALRIVAACAVQQYVSRTPGRLCLIAGDAEGYWELAGKIVSGTDYSIFDPPRYLLRMPGFPLLLALPRLFTGDNPFVARLVLALAATLACGLTYWLGRELAGHTVGLIASVYTAISPTMILFGVMFLSETAFAAAMLASLVAAARLIQNTSQLKAVSIKRLIMQATVTGMLIGLATYMRPTWILAGPALAFAVLLSDRGTFRTAFALAISVCLGLGLIMAPWTIRNWFITGHPIPTTLWVGPSLYDGLNPDANGDSDMEFFERDKLLQSMSEYQMDREYRSRAWDYAINNPGRVVWLAWVKQLRYWSPAPGSAQFGDFRIRLIGWITVLPLFALAAVGAWAARNQWWLLILTGSPILYFAGLHLLFVGSLRYRLPAEYPLSVLAAFGLSQVWPSKSHSRPLESSRGIEN